MLDRVSITVSDTAAAEQRSPARHDRSCEAPSAAFPWDMVPRHMIRDRDRIYGVACHGHPDKPTAPASPWQNGFAERLIGLIRRECVDHIIIPGEAHLRRTLKSYAATASERIGL